MRVSKMLADAREMLVDANKMQKCKIWVKGFQTHNLSYILDANSLSYVNLKIHKISSLFHNFSRKFAILQKCKKCSQIEFYIFQRIFIEIACKVVRLKALDPYFAFWHFVSIHEHLVSIYEHARKIHFL